MSSDALYEQYTGHHNDELVAAGFSRWSHPKTFLQQFPGADQEPEAFLLVIETNVEIRDGEYRRAPR